MKKPNGIENWKTDHIWTTDSTTYNNISDVESIYESENLTGDHISPLTYQLSLNNLNAFDKFELEINWVRPEINISGNNCKRTAETKNKFSSQIKFLPNKEKTISFNIKLTTKKTTINADMLNYDGLTATCLTNPFENVKADCKINGQTLNIKMDKMTEYDPEKQYIMVVEVRNPFSYKQLLEIEFIPDFNYYLEAPDTVSIPYEGKDEFEEEVKVELKIADEKQELLVDKVEFISTDLPNTVTLSKIINSAASSICDGFKLTGYIDDPETLKGPSHVTIKYPNAEDKEISIVFDRIVPMITPTPDNLDIEVQLNKEINHFIQVKIERNLPAIEEE